MQRESVASKKVGRRGSRVKMLNNSSDGKESLFQTPLRNHWGKTLR